MWNGSISHYIIHSEYRPSADAQRRSLERWPERSGATPLVLTAPKERLVVHLQIALL